MEIYGDSSLLRIEMFVHKISLYLSCLWYCATVTNMQMNVFDLYPHLCNYTNVDAFQNYVNVDNIGLDCDL
jgi:hypothetical protein